MPKPATTTLSEIRGGLLNEELSEAINSCTTAVRATGRKGEIVLKLRIEPFDGDAGEVERVTVVDTVTVKLPEKKKRASVFFIDTNNNLQRQQTIPGVDQQAADTAKKAI